jgi:SOS-response transcriptional repressor LexA
MKITTGHKIKIIRTEKKLSLEQLFERTGVHISTLSKIENDKTDPEKETLEKIAKGLGVDVWELMEGDNHDIPQVADTVPVPFWGDIPAGPPTDVQQPGYLGMIPVLRHLAGNGRYVLRVHGDSMFPEFRSDDLILIEQRPDINLQVANGKICAVLHNGGTTFKRLLVEFKKNKPVKVILQPLNTDECDPVEVKLGVDQFQIIGILKELVSRRYS